MFKEYMSEELREQLRYTFKQIRENREQYHQWILDEIEKAVQMIGEFSKIHVLGGLGAKLIRATPNPYNQLIEQIAPGQLQDEEKLKEDDQIELLLEYAMSLATALPDASSIIPLQSDIDEIYQQLARTKSDLSMFETAAETPTEGGDADHWLRTHAITDNIHVRGDGYTHHIIELFIELFEPFADFLERFYGFNAKDLMETILKLDNLVLSKIANPLGASLLNGRLKDWMKTEGKEKTSQIMMDTGKHFFEQFAEANPDLIDPEGEVPFLLREISNIESYPIIFWVIPQTAIEKIIFEKLSCQFGGNGQFFLPPRFKGFILNDTVVRLHPIIKKDERYYHFSLHLGFRNLFRIADELIKSADNVYYDNFYLGNANKESKDNYIERKTLSLFKKMLPNVRFYHSLDYWVPNERGGNKKTELDILGVSKDTVYIIEVKAGLLNDKHKRGALKGLKDRLKQTVTEGSYQCERAKKYIAANELPTFTYIENSQRHALELDKGDIKSYYKITITFEHLAGIASELRRLVENGVLDEAYKWAWIVSIYDLMVFADLIPDEETFKAYLDQRLAIYEREDVTFLDELDVLGYFMHGYALHPVKDGEHFQIRDMKGEIDAYFQGPPIPGKAKPKFKPRHDH